MIVAALLAAGACAITLVPDGTAPTEGSTPRPSVEVADRLSVQSNAQAAVAAVMGSPDEFAGAMFDDSDGWYRLHIFFVEGADLSAVERVLPASVPVEWTLVKHS